MPKKQTFIPPEFATRFPDHALTEMEKDPDQIAFWSNWAAAGDARINYAAAQREIVDADEAWRECRAKAGLSRAAGVECGCGRHWDRCRRALLARDRALSVVDGAVVKFKKG